jgi:hypothetical protein
MSHGQGGILPWIRLAWLGEMLIVIGMLEIIRLIGLIVKGYGHFLLKDIMD